MTEKQIERKLTELVRARGGLCMKFTCPGLVGVPDRIVVTPAGRVCFVELKSPTGKLMKQQEYVIRELKKRNAEVYVLRSLGDVIGFIGGVFGE